MGTCISLSGWERIDTESLNNLTEHKRSILVYPHTSYAEFFIFMDYYQRYEFLRSRSKVVVSPRFIDNWGEILRPLGCIRSTPRDKRDNGGLVQICDELEKSDEFLFLISPKGSMDKLDWRSGYYHIAKHFNCPVIPGGLDFSSHRFVAKKGIEIGNMSLSEFESRLKKEMYDITPMYPERSEFEVKAHSVRTHTSYVPVLTFIILLVVVLVALLLIVK